MAINDAIAILTADHNKVKKLFKEFEAAGDGAKHAKQATVAHINEELSVHAFIEEQVFYPRVREEGKKVNDAVLEALEEHHGMKVLLSELAGMNPGDERYDAKVTVLIEQVEHHVKEEEEELFPKVRKLLDESVLVELGTALEMARRKAPHHADPSAPDVPAPNDEDPQPTSDAAPPSNDGSDVDRMPLRQSAKSDELADADNANPRYRAAEDRTPETDTTPSRT